MFGLLKKKINSFISTMAQKEEGKPEVPEPGQEQQEQIPEEPPQERVEEKPEPPPEEQAPDKPQKPEEPKQEPIQEPPEEPKQAEMIQEPRPTEPEPPKPESPREVEKKEPLAGRPPISGPKPETEPEKPKPAKEEKKDGKIAVKLSLGTKVRSIISRHVEIKENDVKDLLDALSMSLLESDVAYEVSEHIVESLRSKLVGMRVSKGKANQSVKQAVRASLLELLSVESTDILKFIEEKPKPVKILFLGPNGAGKTTTMAKVASMLMKQGHSCVFSASDTFRAAAIEQAEKHGERLGIRVIKHKYGSDPTAVAFDAVSYAKANNIDVVLIDSAGRQETNRNLIDEVRKLSRVIKPDFKIFVGESIAGNALVSQVKSFSEAVGLNGVILTKLDCDAKGGTALSLTKATGVPILYFGVGQEYGDLVKFDPAFVVDQILG